MWTYTVEVGRIGLEDAGELLLVQDEQVMHSRCTLPRKRSQ